MNVRSGLAAAVAVCCFVAQAGAEEIAPSHREAIKELIGVLEVEHTILSPTAMADAMVQANPDLMQFRDVIVDWASFMKWENFEERYVEIYADTFSETEARDLIRFYHTPTGKKSLEAIPELMLRGAQLGSDVATQHQDDLHKRLEERAAELNAQAGP